MNAVPPKNFLFNTSPFMVLALFEVLYLIPTCQMQDFELLYEDPTNQLLKSFP